jgi:hypothetical protein
LYTKYSSIPASRSELELSDWIEGASVKAIIDFKYNLALEEDDEHLKRCIRG